MAIYLSYQAKGQLSVLLNSQPFSEYQNDNMLSGLEKENYLLIEKIKKYSVDSFDYSPTKNYTTIYKQKNEPLLWVITASEPYTLKPYEWTFPIVGKVSYKGFFKKNLAQKEYNHLVSLGYDVDLRSVSAWSTLGWFRDPLLSTMLKRSKGSLCNLLFHELFHSTYYASGKVDFNENLANFVAHKATLQFLKNDSLELNKYLANYNDNIIFNNYIFRQTNYLKSYYSKIKLNPNKYELKLKAIFYIADSIAHLPLKNPSKFVQRKKDILKFKNAYFIDFQQYDSMQDSLELVFNKIYKAKLKKLVQDLKLN